MITTPPPAKEYMPFAVAWTREDCDKFEAAGVLDYHYELIEGVIIRKRGQHLPHAATVSNAFAWLIGHFDKTASLHKPVSRLRRMIPHVTVRNQT